MLNVKEFLQEQAAKYTEAVESYDVELAKAKEEGKLEGIEIGKDQIQLPDAGNPDAQYTQEQMNKAVNDGVANAVVPLQAHVEQLQKDAAEKQSELAAAKEESEKAKADLQAALRDEEVIKAEAIKAFKGDLKAQYEAQQVAEKDSETGFGKLLEE